MAGGPRRGGRRRKSMLFHSKWYYIDYKDTELLNVLSQNVVNFTTSCNRHFSEISTYVDYSYQTCSSYGFITIC